MCLDRQDTSLLAIGLDLQNQLLGLIWSHQGQGEPRAGAATAGAVAGVEGLAPLFPRDCGLGWLP